MKGHVPDRLMAFLRRVEGRFRHRPYYVSEPSGWVIAEEGRGLARGLQTFYGVHMPVVGIQDTHHLCRQLVHFGSFNVFREGGYKAVAPSNRIALTVFHIDMTHPSADETRSFLCHETKRVDRLIVSCGIMRRRMEEWGICHDRLVTIPLGVDTRVFRPMGVDERRNMRAGLGIGPQSIVIGSFEKDGVGFDQGFEPKKVKGPDIFLAVLARLRRDLPLFVLLTGPARGYVKSGLERMGIPFAHLNVATPEGVGPLYSALDLYLITSREEGGPKGLLEAMACGVPVVTTSVGMAADIVRDGENGMLCAIEDVESLHRTCLLVVGDKRLAERLRHCALADIVAYDQDCTVRRHYELVYAPLLVECGVRTQKRFVDKDLHDP